METQPRSLNTLYKLLWEQIKDNYCYDLNIELDEMWDRIPMSSTEFWLIENHINDNFQNETSSEFERKEFVQRMIKETENDN